MKISSPNAIYNIILEELVKLIDVLHMDYSNEYIKDSYEGALIKIQCLHNEAETSIKHLMKNAEWDVFNIAFYGETNAGKSTLIETLRIIFSESGKMKEHTEFNRYIKIMQENENKLCEKNKIKSELSNKYQFVENNYNEQLRIIDEKQISEQQKIEQYTKDIVNLKLTVKSKRKCSILNFLKAIFGILDEQRTIKELHICIRDCESVITTIEREREEVLNEKESKLTDEKCNAHDLEETIKHLEKENEAISNELSSYNDGKTIGDGRSDFTKEVVAYHFERNGQKFALLDLPGIEGKESTVVHIINDAVQTAHVVFYISIKPNSPQVGSDGKEGTLEKIKKHLNQHTEVYAIFNKRAKNPKQMIPNLTEENEKEALLELDNVMRDILGEQYMHNLVLCAYPAFLAVANCWKNGYTHCQKKFIKHFGSREKLLSESLVRDFSDWMIRHLVNDCKRKIIKSNYRKAYTILTNSYKLIGNTHTELLSLEDKLKKSIKATDNQIDEAANIFEKNLENAVSSTIYDMQINLRKNVYCEIDRNIDNKEFRDIIEVKSKEALECLAKELEGRIDEIKQQFIIDVNAIIEKFHRYAFDLIDIYFNASDIDISFKHETKIKSDFNKLGAITSILGAAVGVIFCLTNPAGWIVLALSIISFAFSTAKAIVSFFNHDYRASQQKITADKIIDDIGTDITEKITSIFEESNKQLQLDIQNIKEDMYKLIAHVEDVNRIFDKTKNKYQDLCFIIENDELL